MMRIVWSSLLTIVIGASACATEPEFHCYAHCLSDAVDDGVVENEGEDVISAPDLGAAVTACEMWLTCNASPNDRTSCLCAEER